MAYNLAVGFPKATLRDFIQTAKFHLCQATNTLMKDSIWDSYNDAEIIMEFFAHRFLTSESLRDEFVEEFDIPVEGIKDDDLQWMEDAIAQNQKDREESLGEIEEFIFSPDDIKVEE